MKYNENTVLIILIIITVSGIIMLNYLGEKANKSNKNETTTQTTTSETTTTVKTTTTTVKTTKKVKKPSQVATASKQEYIEYARTYSNYNDTQMQCLDWLWEHESNWNPNSSNVERDVCGIPQSHPCNKIVKQQGSYDWQAQIRWGINYINYKYKNPCSAWNHYKNSRPHGY